MGFPKYLLERETGIEPATTGLGSRCSTIELLPRSRITDETIIPRHCLWRPPVDDLSSDFDRCAQEYF
jgi:hypothetical protein